MDYQGAFNYKQGVIKMNKHNALIVLKALLAGHEFEYYNNILTMLDEQMVFKLEKHSNNTVSDHYVGCDMTVTHFIKWTSEMSEDNITILVANMALNSINKKERILKP